MAKYIDIENATLSWNEADKQGVGDDFIGGVLFALDCLTAKEEDIVRCKDCKYNVANMEGDPLDATDYTDIVCSYFMTDGIVPNGFCNHGKRKETA